MSSLVLALVFIFVLINTIDGILWIKYFTFFNVIIIVLMITGMILFSFGLMSNYSQFTTGSGTVINNYGFFLAKDVSWANLGFVRSGGYYDEPGSLAYIVSFLLLLNKKYFNYKFIEVFLLIFPLFSGSLAHIVTCILYLLLFSLKKRNLGNFIVTIFLLMCCVLILNLYKDKNDNLNMFYKQTIERVENIISTGEDNGSRDGGYSLGPEIFNRYNTGISPGDVKNKYPDFVHETFWGPILYYGIFGYPFYIMIYVFIFFDRLNRKDTLSIKFLILIIANLLQRPYYQYPILMILLYLLFFYDKNILLDSNRKLK
jgi:hypothetical protein